MTFEPINFETAVLSSVRELDLSQAFYEELAFIKRFRHDPDGYQKNALNKVDGFVECLWRAGLISHAEMVRLGKLSCKAAYGNCVLPNDTAVGDLFDKQHAD